MLEKLKSIKEQAKAFVGKRIGDLKDRELLTIITGMIIKLHAKVDNLKPKRGGKR